MDGQKISDMQALSEVDAGVIIPVVHQGVNKRIPALLLKGLKGDPGESIKGDPGAPGKDGEPGLQGPPGITADVFVQDVFSWSGNISLLNNGYFNLWNLQGLAKAPGGTLDAAIVGDLLRVPGVEKLSQVVFVVRLSGSIGGSTNTAREWRIQLRRPNGTDIVASVAEFKVSGNDVSNRDVSISSFTNGSSDPFSTNGIQLGLYNVSGSTITLTDASIRVQRIINPQ
ncbi:hypothetical protein [Aeromonas phage PVN05]|nr:hypothetical protein [Aeromonas phage PVN05]